MTKRITILLISICLIAIVLAIVLAVRTPPTSRHTSSTQGLPEGGADIRIAGLQILEGLPLYVAIDDGLFEQAGLHPNWKPFDSSDLAFNEIRIGSADVAFGGIAQALELEAASPGAIKIVATPFSTTCLLAGKRSNAPRQISELAGRRIGIFPGSAFEAYVIRVLEKEGVPSNTYERVKLPSPLQLQQLGPNGDLDAVFSLEPVGAQAVARGIGTYLTQDDLLSKNFLAGKPFPGACIVISRAALRRQPAIEERLLAALDAATSKIRQPAFPLLPYLRHYTKYGETDAASLSFRGIAVGADIDRNAVQILSDLLNDWRVVKDRSAADRALAP